jgi:hypothetical protein
MKKYLRLLLLVPFCFVLCSQTAFTAEDSVTTQRVTLGTSKCPKKRCKQNNKSKESKLQAKCFSVKQAYTPFYYIKSIGVDGETLVTTDETMWQISKHSTKIASRWSPNCTITITPSSWYSSYDYYLVNNTTGEQVTAKLSQGPFLEYAIFITHLNPYNGTVSLSNGMQWHVSRNRNFASWQVGQAVLIGNNSSWFGKDHILININENNYATSDRLF